MSSGYTLLFENEICLIRDEKSGMQVPRVTMMGHHLFLLEIDSGCCANIVTSSLKIFVLWHKRYDHLHFKGL